MSLIKKIKNWIQNKIDDYHFWLAARVAAETQQQILTSILCSIGPDELSRVLDQMQKNMNTYPGHCDYSNLAKLLGEIMLNRKMEGLTGSGCRVCGCPNHFFVNSK